MDNPTSPVSLAVKLWTTSDFENERKQQIKNNIIQVAIGWALVISFVILGPYLFDLVDNSCASWIGLAAFGIGLWLGLIKWIYRSYPGNYNPNNISTWRKEASQQLDWFRNVKCPKCGQNVKVNVGYLEYNCQECGGANIKRAGISENPPEKIIMQGTSCASCKKPITFRDRQAQFMCPECKSEVELNNIPIDELNQQTGLLSNQKEVSPEDNIRQALENLIYVYEKFPQGFVRGSGGVAEEEIRKMGSILNRQGGIELMRLVHERFARSCNVRGASRNLEHLWDGIGEWHG